MNSVSKRLQIIKLASTVFFSVALLATIAVTNNAQAEATPQGSDPLLRAMQQELDREKGLLLPGMQKPYFVEYRLDDIASYEAVANYGALTREESNHQRIVRVTVRIGDYAIDSSSSRGDGTLELAPTDDNPLALQYALWTATDAAYKNALRAYSAKQGRAETVPVCPVAAGLRASQTSRSAHPARRPRA